MVTLDDARKQTLPMSPESMKGIACQPDPWTTVSMRSIIWMATERPLRQPVANHATEAAILEVFHDGW